MKSSLFYSFCSFLLLIFLLSCCQHPHKLGQDMQKESPYPKVLYKIVSLENWEKISKEKEGVFFPSFKGDTDFVHLSTKEQAPRIAKKFFPKGSSLILLVFDPQKFPGELRYESNPGGKTKYYHLYGSNLPKSAFLRTEPIYLEE